MGKHSHLDILALLDVGQHLACAAEAVNDAGVGEGAAGDFADTDVIDVEPKTKTFR